MTIKREGYMRMIRPFIDQTELVKVLIGVRRSGKSVMLELIKQELMEKGVSPDNIISLNFEDLTYANYSDALALHAYLKPKIDAINQRGRAYVFLDEIQEVDAWEKCVNSLRVNSNADIYVTGSNAKLFLGEYATLLTGRYVEFEIYPFSYEEYLSAREMADSDLSFKEYLTYGGMPFIAASNLDPSAKMQYLKDIYASVVVKDIVKRNKLRDVDLLERIIAFALSNIGNTFSANSICAYLKSERRTVTVDTVINYMNFCEKAFLLRRLNRVDLKGKLLLKINEKYYMSDHGLRQALFGTNFADIERVLENIVCFELLRRGCSVAVGKNGDKEIDFVCDKCGKRFYVQVSYLLASEETIKREFGAYEGIDDNFPKYVVSMDALDMSRNGIVHKNIRDFILKFPE